MMSLMEAALATGGTALGGNPRLEGVSTDSRTVASGELFIALRGERFDGHEYVEAAAARGAAAAMVEAAWAEGRSLALPTLAVADTRLALGYLGAWWRARFELPLVGVTGSNGKTTVKEMTAAILRARAQAEGFDPELAVLATAGNLNNDIGLPQMLLRLHGSHRAAVIEMGMNHPGEIAYLSRLAQPTVALVNNAQRAHLAGLGGVAEVARAKGEIFDGLCAGGTAVINADDPFCELWRGMNAGRRILSFGLDQPAEVRGRVEAKALGSRLAIEAPQGAVTVQLQVPGVHNARNALAAAAVALAAGADLAAVSAGLSFFRGVKGRLQIRPAAAGAVLIDDSYNANPDSVRAAVDVLAAVPAPRVLVLGDMGEVGAEGPQFHREVGAYAAQRGVDRLLALGDACRDAAAAFGAGAEHFASVDALIERARALAVPGATLLVKGSRFMRMERVVAGLVRRADASVEAH